MLTSLRVTGQIVPVSEIHPSGRKAIGTYAQFLIDDTNKLKVEDFFRDSSRYSFASSSHDILNFGPIKSTVWIRFAYNDEDSVKQYLEVSNSNLNEIDYYVYDHQRLVTSAQAGLSRGQADAEFKFNVFLFELPRVTNGKTFSVYLRVYDKRRVIVPLWITDFNSVVKISHRTDFFFGMYFGGIAIIAIINLFIFVYFRERLYLFYSLHICGQILINGILQGYLLSLFGDSFFFLSPYVPAIAAVSNVFFIVFSLEFLQVKQYQPDLYKASFVVMAMPLMNIFLNVFGLFQVSAIAGTYIGILVSIWLIILGGVMYQKKVTQARFYMIGWGAFFVGIVVLNAALNGWIPLTRFSFNAAVFGTLFEVLLISSALVDRINVLRHRYDFEKTERLRLVEQQNVWLEENVKLRTTELHNKNNEIESQNEELKQQHEELSATHDLVETQKQLLEAQNERIAKINHELEEKVMERTVQLEEMVKSLIQQNNDLEQFSYIVSHNMRAPVARIMGLVNLLEIDTPGAIDRKLILDFLKEAANGVDVIIHDLSQIIAVRKGIDTLIEKINVEQMVRHVLSDLSEEATKAGATITTNVEVKEMRSVRSYLQSILYNLISNAIKYRDPERPSEISLKITEDTSVVIIDVVDNGLGIDLPSERMNEVFHLYKRLHTHVQGKGLGLYLVKTQVEGLQGTVEVKRGKTNGTVFRISLPKTSVS